MSKKSSVLSLLQTEYQNTSAFFVVAMAFGILAAVSGVAVPLWGISVLGVVVGIICCIKSCFIFRPLAGVVLFGLLGFFIMTLRLSDLPVSMVSKPLYNVDVAGRIERVFGAPDKPKIILSQVQFLNRHDIVAPEQVQLTYDAAQPAMATGDEVIVQASLRAPRKAVAPFAYDEALRLAFEGIGAVGSIQKVKRVQAGLSGIERKTESIRTAISRRIEQQMPDEAARVAIPLAIGNQDVVSAHLYDIFQSAGMTHILSVSGFHLSLLVAFIFLIVRSMLSLLPWIGDYVSAKKVAAVVAMLGAIVYTYLSGMQVPALRSLLMVGIVLIALFFDREALSVRSWAVAAFCLLVLRPELVLNIGFQLSFMAVLVLVTLYPMLRNHFWPRKRRAFGQCILLVFGGFILIDLLMTLVTTPFVIYHFNRYALYSCLGNVLTGVLFSFWIMPMLFLGLILMPIGADGIFLKGAAIGIEYVIAVCEGIHALPGAVIFVPAFSALALVIIAGGIMMMCLMVTRLRWTGLIVMGIGWLMAVATPRPDVMIGDNGMTVAVRENGMLRFLSKGPTDWTARSWLLRNGENPETPVVVRPATQVSAAGKRIAFEAGTCFGADICFLPEPNPRQPNAWPLYDEAVRMLYVRPDGIEVKNP